MVNSLSSRQYQAHQFQISNLTKLFKISTNLKAKQTRLFVEIVATNSDLTYYLKKIHFLIDIQNFRRIKIDCITTQKYLKVWNLNVNIKLGNKFRLINILKRLRINCKVK